MMVAGRVIEFFYFLEGQKEIGAQGPVLPMLVTRFEDGSDPLPAADAHGREAIT